MSNDIKKGLVLACKRVENTRSGGARYEVTYIDKDDIIRMSRTKPDSAFIKSNMDMELTPEHHEGSGGRPSHRIYSVIEFKIDGMGRIGMWRTVSKQAREIGRLAGHWF